MLQCTASSRIYPLRSASQCFIHKRQTDPAVCSCDQDCFVRNIHDCSPFSIVFRSKTAKTQADIPRFAHCAGCACERYTSAVTPLRYRFAQRHIPLSGAMIVLPSWVKEYSTATVLELVTRLATSPVDSRFRRDRVSMRCETFPTRRRNSPCR